MTTINSSDVIGKIEVKCRLKSGNSVDLEVVDISHGGCMVDRKRWNCDPGDRVLVKLPGLAFQPGDIVWVEDEHAGIAFEQPLYDAVLTHLRNSVSQAA